MLTELSQCKSVVGAKQVRRAVEGGSAGKVFLAQDADPRVTGPIADLCREKAVETETVPSMKALGKACGIAVGSAVAALLK